MNLIFNALNFVASKNLNMKTITTVLLSFFIALGSLQAQNIQSEKSSVTFSLSNMAFKTVEGTFSNLTGGVTFDLSNLANTTMDVCIDANTINTENEKRDEHLKNEDFFDVAQFPTICFKATTAKAVENGFEVTGNLTMHGITKTASIVFNVKDNTYTGTMIINRKDFEVGMDYGNFMVGEEVTIQITAVIE